MDLYDILEIDTKATEIEIKKAYYKLAKKYHPDKNNSSEANDKFLKIQSAYEILINETSRRAYTQLPTNEKYTFNTLLTKIINDNINFDDLINHCSQLRQDDFEYIQNHFYNFLQKINAIDILNLTRGFIAKNNYSDIIYSDSDIDIYEDIYAEYYHTLPLNIQKYNKYNIKIELTISINDIVNNIQRKIKIKRTINDTIVISTFIFNSLHQYIVYRNLGDCHNNDSGNLIIKLNIENIIYWNSNTLLLAKNISLYQLIYGIDIILSIGNNHINISNWLPYNDGFIINITEKYKIKCNHNILLKLLLDYKDTEDNQIILKKYFS